jgi:hypothetical protein
LSEQRSRRNGIAVDGHTSGTETCNNAVPVNHTRQ